MGAIDCAAQRRQRQPTWNFGVDDLRRVGVLGVDDMEGTEWWTSLISELRRQGHVEGGAFVFVKKSCGEELSRLEGLASELVAERVDTLPILMTASSGDPMEDGLISSLAKPGWQYYRQRGIWLRNRDQAA